MLFSIIHFLTKTIIKGECLPHYKDVFHLISLGKKRRIFQIPLTSLLPNALNLYLGLMITLDTN